MWYFWQLSSVPLPQPSFKQRLEADIGNAYKKHLFGQIRYEQTFCVFGTLSQTVSTFSLLSQLLAHFIILLHNISTFSTLSELLAHFFNFYYTFSTFSAFFNLKYNTSTFCIFIFLSGNTMRLRHFLLEDSSGQPFLHRQNINIEDGGVNQVMSFKEGDDVIVGHPFEGKH